MRHRSALAILPVLLLLAGCAAEPAARPSPEPTNTAPTPTATPTPSTAPSTEEPPVSGEPTEPSEPQPEQFSASELVALCTDKIRGLAPDATYFPDRATTEWLQAASLWFVVVPKEADAQQSAGVCGIGGTAGAPIFEMHGETLLHGVGEVRDDLLGADGHAD